MNKPRNASLPYLALFMALGAIWGVSLYLYSLYDWKRTIRAVEDIKHFLPQRDFTVDTKAGQ